MYRFTRSSFAAQVNFVTNASGELFGVYTANGITGTLAGLSMPNSGEFTGLFDQYKLLSYTVELIPRWSGLDISGDNTPALPTIYWIYDTDDNATPTSMNDIMERPFVRRMVLRGPTKLTCKAPSVAAMLYKSTTTTGYTAKRSPWVDINDGSLPHFGIKWALVGNASSTYTLDMRVTWRFMCKNPR